MAAEIAGGRQNEVSIAITPSGESGTFQVLLDGKEVYNRKSLKTDNAVPDPKAVKTVGAEVRGKLIAAIDRATTSAGAR
jgi:predicted Rdx family selenoprotein